MPRTIETAGSLCPGTANTPLDKRCRVVSKDDILHIEVPFVGMLVYVEETAKFYVITGLTSKQIGAITVENAAVSTYEELSPTAQASTITLPIPSDDDGENLSLVIDFSADGTFVNDDDGTPQNYCRVTMLEHFQCMKIFRHEQWEDLLDNCVGLPDYGSSVSFTLDSTIFPGYVPGKKYYARYKWLDTNYSGDDWTAFCFSGDVSDMRPVRNNSEEAFSIKEHNSLTGKLAFDYGDGDVQNFSLAADATLDLSDISGVAFGSALILNCNPEPFKLTVTNGEERQMVCSGNKMFVIAVTNFGSMQIAVTETV